MRGPLLVAACIVVSLACDDSHESDDDNFRSDVIACEEAVARLASCCPDFDPSTVECTYDYRYNEGCGTFSNETTYPSLMRSESACIRETGCSEIVAKDICTRAAQVTSRHLEEDGDIDASVRGPLPEPRRAKEVCP